MMKHLQNTKNISECNNNITDFIKTISNLIGN